MKSKFSRFLHYILSYSGAKPDTASALSYSDLIGVSRSNQVADLSNLDYRVKPDNDSVCAGRSMVEMLGVLAIIGVLSVGAIAGYSKAMTKYKLNKQAEQISWLLNVLNRYKTFFGKEPERLDFVPYLIKLGEIPQEMIKDKSGALYDSFGMRYEITTNGCEPTCLYANLVINVMDNYKNFDICNNIFETSKAFTAQLDHINFFKTQNDNTYDSLYVMGDKRCSKNGICLRKLTKNDIYEICQLCADKKNCSFNIQYSIKD